MLDDFEQRAKAEGEDEDSVSRWTYNSGTTDLR
jgi:hypothetical protein